MINLKLIYLKAGDMTLFNLDIHTIIVLLILGNLTVLSILIAYKSGVSQNRSYRQFIAGKMLQTIAWLLLWQRGNIPDSFSVYIGNTLLISGFALETLSLTNAKEFNRRREIIFGVLAVTGIAAFWAFADTPNRRVGIASLAVFLLYGTASVEMIRTFSSSRLRMILGFFCGLFSIFLIFRGGTALFAQREFALMTPNMIQTFTFVQAYFLMLVGGIGFLLMLKERDDTLLFESEEKYRTLVEKANEAIVIIQDRTFVYANTRMSILLGIPNETIIGMPMLDVVHPDDRDIVLESHEKRISGENLYKVYDFRLSGTGGKQIWVSISASRIQWKGRPATLSLLTDINLRKNMEAERERMISELRKALEDVKALSGLLPICASCKKIRDDNGYWNQIEEYISNHSEAEFSHGLCPDCVKKMYPGVYKKLHEDEKI